MRQPMATRSRSNPNVQLVEQEFSVPIDESQAEAIREQGGDVRTIINAEGVEELVQVTKALVLQEQPRVIQPHRHGGRTMGRTMRMLPGGDEDCQ